MSTATLRYAPWQDKSHLSRSQYDSLTAAVSKVLCHTISLPDSHLDVAWARSFVRTYAQDDAQHAMQVLDKEVKGTKLNPHELSVHRLTLQLAKRLAQIRDGLDVSVLVDLAVSYGAGNASSMKSIFQESCMATPSLRESFVDDVVPAFEASLQDVQNRSASSTRKVAYVLSQLLRCGPTIVVSFVQTKDFILKLATCYHAGLDNFANYHGGVTLQVQDPAAAAGWQRDWLYTKASLVDSFHAIVQTLLECGHNEQLFDLLFSILDLPSSSISEHTAPIPFISQPLLADYQYAFDLSGVLSDKLQGADDARTDLLASTLAKLSPSPHGTKPAGGLSLIIKKEPLGRKIEPATGSDGKGKGKARIQDPVVCKIQSIPHRC
jgi:activating signal cointegrator complex subunit 2